MTTFLLGDVLSVTTGVLVSRDHITGVYRVCNFMAGEALATHKLPRVTDEITPEILRQHPRLADIKVPDWSHLPRDREIREAAVYAWLDEMEIRYGATVDLVPLTSEDHTSIDSISEFIMKLGG